MLLRPGPGPPLRRRVSSACGCVCLLTALAGMWWPVPASLSGGLGAARRRAAPPFCKERVV